MLHLLQPENLLLDSYGVLKVSDFGLSAFAQQVRVSGTQLLPGSLSLLHVIVAFLGRFCNPYKAFI